MLRSFALSRPVSCELGTARLVSKPPKRLQTATRKEKSSLGGGTTLSSPFNWENLMYLWDVKDEENDKPTSQN
jgi:hypothetical protein